MNKWENIRRIRGHQLRPGMIIGPSPIEKDPIKLPAITGGCEKGTHFGSACYDKIGTWFRYVPVKEKV